MFASDLERERVTVSSQAYDSDSNLATQSVRANETD